MLPVYFIPGQAFLHWHRGLTYDSGTTLSTRDFPTTKDQELER